MMTKLKVTKNNSRTLRIPLLALIKTLEQMSKIVVQAVVLPRRRRLKLSS